MFSYALSEPEAGSDAAAMRSRAVRDGDAWVLNGAKRWITNAGISQYYTVMAVTDPEARSRESPCSSCTPTTKASPRRPREEDGDQGLAHPGVVLRQRAAR